MRGLRHAKVRDIRRFKIQVGNRGALVVSILEFPMVLLVVFLFEVAINDGSDLLASRLNGLLLISEC